MGEFELDVKEKEMFVQSEETHNKLLGGIKIPVVDISTDFCTQNVCVFKRVTSSFCSCIVGNCCKTVSKLTGIGIMETITK